MDKNSLSHTTWNCKYHIVFAPKYRRQIIYGKIKSEIGKILRVLCERKGIEIIEAEAGQMLTAETVRRKLEERLGRETGCNYVVLCQEKAQNKVSDDIE